MRFQKTVSTLLVPLVLCACQSGRENFSTEPGEGFGWKSMQENHQLIQKDIHSDTQSVLGLTNTPEPYLMQSIDKVERSPEKYLKVWFAPYQDASGNLHTETSIHTVIQNGQWYVPSLSD